MKSSLFSRLIAFCAVTVLLGGCVSGSDEALGEYGPVSEQRAPAFDADAVTPLNNSLLRAAALDSRVRAEVIRDLQNANRARVIVSFAVPELKAKNALTYGSRERRIAQSAIQSLADRLIKRVGAIAVHRRYDSLNALAVTLDPDGLSRLLTEPAVLNVARDEFGTGHLRQALPLSRFLAVHGQGLRGAGVTVAVVDSGVDTTHPDIAGSLVGEACFCSGNGGCCPRRADQGSGPKLTQNVGSGSAKDDHGHGSNVAGVITSDGVAAPAGGAPDAKIVAVKVLDANNAFQSSSDVLAGFDWILTNRPDVKLVNASLGTTALFPGQCDQFPDAIPWRTAVDTLYANNVMLFASSGNQGSSTHLPLPACLKHTFSVGAVWDSNVGGVTVLGCTDASTAADKVTCFTNSNAELDLVAPGAPMSSTGLGGGESTFYGTSQASPLAAACAALLLQRKPSLTPSDLASALRSSAVRVVDAKNGLSFPRLDCEKALDWVGKPECRPDCRDRVCGNDGCGGSCGTCGAGQVCSDGGQCELANNCTAPEWKYDVEYVKNSKVSYGGKEYVAAYWTHAQNPATNNGAIGSGQPWLAPTLCGPCVPDCSGKSCGTDNCGGTCGVCSQDYSCSEQGACLADASCTGVPTWTIGAYGPGAIVQSVGNRYECKSWGASGWCGLASEYEPGVGRAWRSAWLEIGRCSSGSVSSSRPIGRN